MALKKGPTVEPEQWQEFQKLQAEAARRLDDGDWVLRLSVWPAFDDWRVLGVRRVKRGVEVVGRRWWRGDDAAKFVSPVERMRWPRVLVPTVDERSTMAEEGLIDELLTTLGGVMLSIAPVSSMIGLDGVRYALSVQDAMIAARLRWWEGHPEAWRPLMVYFGEAWRRLDAHIETDWFEPMAFAWERAG